MQLLVVPRLFALLVLLSVAACGGKSDTAPQSSASSALASSPGESSVPPVSASVSAGPADASSAGERFGDWTIKCAPAPGTAPNQVDCAISQQVFDKTSNRRVEAFAVNAVQGGGVKGALLLPLGLDLEAGVKLRLDAATDGPDLRFHTCLPTGCLVDLAFPPETVALFRTAKAMHLTASGTDGAAPDFVLTMNGFAQALDRAMSIAKGH